MDENPYRSPQFNQPAETRELLPLWRRIISTVLLFFGISYLCCVPGPAIVLGLNGHWIGGVACAMLYLVLGAAMTWYGLRLRRPPLCNT
jgi:hypothetical protein